MARLLRRAEASGHPCAPPAPLCAHLCTSTADCTVMALVKPTNREEANSMPAMFSTPLRLLLHTAHAAAAGPREGGRQVRGRARRAGVAGGMHRADQAASQARRMQRCMHGLSAQAWQVPGLPPPQVATPTTKLVPPTVPGQAGLPHPPPLTCRIRCPTPASQRRRPPAA